MGYGYVTRPPARGSLRVPYRLENFLRRCITAILMVTLITLGPAAPTSAQEQEARPACGQQINARYIACVHRAHGHTQYQGGRGTPRHTWISYQRQARQLRNYLISQYVAAVRRNLVNRWSGVAQCESGGNWRINTGNGYYGGLQFSLSTWRGMGGRGYPHQQPAWYQAQIADNLRRSSGLHHWPTCGRLYR